MPIRSIIFVCLGNICRSPLALGIARKICQEHALKLKLDSAGTGAWHVGEPPCEGSILIANKRGIDLSTHRARKIKDKDIEDFDLIVAMDSRNLSDLKALGFPREKLLLLGEVAHEGADVPDPYHFRGEEGFVRVFEMIHEGVLALFEHYKII